jgi:peroxiredoxin family protein
VSAAAAEGLGLVVFSGGFDRVHYALVMASAAAATNREATLFFTGRAVAALAAPDDAGRPGWHRLDPADDGASPAERDAGFAARGIGGFEELLEACVALGVRIVVCEMALRAAGMEDAKLREDVPMVRAGVVTLLNETPGRLLFV